jgi:diguanylate cyclase (GGDEF)-like protein
VQWHVLRPSPGPPSAAFLVFARDRGHRAWLLAEDGRLVAEVPRGDAADGQVGTRGLTLPLPVQGGERLWLAVEATLGTFADPAVEPLPDFIAAERSAWVFDAGFSAVLVALVLLSLAFHASLRDRMYLAYACYLLLMLAALWGRHPVAFRHAALLGLEPERVAALGVLASALAAWAVVELMRAAAGIAEGHPRGLRILRAMTLANVLLALVDVATIVAAPAVAHAVFNAINALFGASALGSAALLMLAARGGGRMPRLFLAGWVPVVAFGAWFSLGPVLGLPQPGQPRHFILAACAVQGLIWAGALADRALRLQRERDLAKALAENDPLTGLPNRRALDRALAAATAGTVMLFDLDRFKAINDRFGHAAGDECLRRFATVLDAHVAGRGICGRFGGEEFLAVLEDGDAATARGLAEEVRAATEALRMDLGGVRVVLTVSVGFAPIVDGAAAALAGADRALYRAKAEGRNRVESGTG